MICKFTLNPIATKLNPSIWVRVAKRFAKYFLINPLYFIRDTFIW